MKKKQVIEEIRKTCGVKRIDPRRLFAVDDGACTWIGDRADLSAKDARDLRAVSAAGTRPDLADAETRRQADEADYDAICTRCRCIAATHGSAGPVRFEDLPEDWRDGSALGPIMPL